MSESRRAFRGTNEELRRELPNLAEPVPDDPAETWVSVYARIVALVITVAAFLYYAIHLSVIQP